MKRYSRVWRCRWSYRLTRCGSIEQAVDIYGETVIAHGALPGIGRHIPALQPSRYNRTAVPTKPRGTPSSVSPATQLLASSRTQSLHHTPRARFPTTTKR